MNNEGSSFLVNLRVRQKALKKHGSVRFVTDLQEPGSSIKSNGEGGGMGYYCKHTSGNNIERKLVYQSPRKLIET